MRSIAATEIRHEGTLKSPDDFGVGEILRSGGRERLACRRRRRRAVKMDKALA